MFVGSGTSEYTDRLKLSPSCEQDIELADLFPCLLPNRISRQLDVHGPSELISAACTSSLVAVHRAAQALFAGECDAALAGGINLIISPDVFLASDRAGLLSEDGGSRMFDQAAQGWRRGEGAGMLLLKPLAQALAEGDSIHAVIRGTAVNHAGATTSLLAPNYPVQIAAVQRAYQRANVCPDSVSLVVAQGTGNDAADALELHVFALAFSQLSPHWSDLPGRCAVACLKPNFGHLESASGIASLILAIQALKHARLPGISGLQNLNARAASAESPFRLSALSRDWTLPDSETAIPRRASVHNFGFGGTTAHLVLEEFLPVRRPVEEASPGGQVIILSARNRERLRESARVLLAYLQHSTSSSESLHDIAWTLQVGREEFSERLAILAPSKVELQRRLQDFLADTLDQDHIFFGSVTSNAGLPVQFGREPEDRAFLGSLVRNGKWSSLAEFWLRGLSIPWESLPRPVACRRVSLPTYPFAKDRHWIERPSAFREQTSQRQPETEAARVPDRTNGETLESRCFRLLRNVLEMPAVEPSLPDPIRSRTPQSLGIDSLRAMAINGRLAREFGAALPLRSWLSRKTIQELVAELARIATSADESTSLPELASNPAQRFAPFPLTDLQWAYFLGRADNAPLGGNGCQVYWEWETDSWEIPRLEAAWNRILSRHDMLRAVVHQDGTQQVWQHVPSYCLEILDLRRDSEHVALNRVANLRERLTHERIATDRWPLFRIAVSQWPDCMRLHFRFDLLIADAQSLFLILREWASEYAAPHRLEPVPGGLFRDYVLALQEVRLQKSLQFAVDYWDRRLANLPSAPQLPMNGELASVRRPRFFRMERRLSADTWSRLRQQFRSREITESTGLLSAFAEALARRSRSPHFTLVQTISQRLPIHPEIGRIVGDFTSTVLLEVDFRELRTFEERANSLQRRITDDLDHSMCSGVQVLAKLSQLRGTPVIIPIVFTSLLGQDTGFESLGRFVGGVTQTPQVTLDCQVMQIQQELAFSFDVAEGVFPAGVIEDLFEDFAGRLEQLANDLAAWGELPGWVTEQPPFLFNQLSIPLTDDLLISDFLKQVAIHPERIAVQTATGAITYAELYQRAAAMSQRLRQRGAQHDPLIAVLAEKSAGQVIGVLAVLLTGAAYLPIEVSLPEQRIRELLQIGEVRFAVTTPDQVIPKTDDVDWLVVDEEQSLDQGPLPMLPPCSADDLAYVIFTSGSTGVPKGVKISHRSAVNTIRDINRRFQINPADRVLALSALGFDLSVYDIFGLLGAGGTIVMPDAHRLRDAGYLADLVVQARITVWNSVPSYCQLLAEACESMTYSQLDSLRVILLSGDWIPVSLPDRIRRHAPAAKVISLGGATEASIWSICYPIDEVNPCWSSIPYGKPLANQQFHVLNDRFENCPEGVAGELFIGGIGLAQGYWQDEELTAARFPQHPITGARLYRTGDRGCWRPDGNIEFLGREDLQVKVGGFRVELGEIEAALSARADIEQAVVVAFNDEQQQRRLAGFYVSRSHRDITASQMRAFLQQRLPDYMIPFRWFREDALPLTSNGKLDRKSLTRLAAENSSVVSHRHGLFLPLTRDHDDISDPVFHELLTSPEIIKDISARQSFVAERRAVRQYLQDQPYVALPDEIDQERRSRMGRRQSPRKFLASKPIAWGQLTSLLNAVRSQDFHGSPRFLYPSAGGTYGLQLYLLVKNHGCESLADGTYYYDPSRHELRRIHDQVLIPAGIHLPSNQALFDQAGLAIFLVADLSAIRPMYGDLSLDLAKLEAGYMSQVLLEAAADAGFGLCPMGYVHFSPLRELFRLSDRHVLIHSLIGGIPDWQKDAVHDPPVHHRRGIASPLSNGRLLAEISAIWAETLQLSQVDLDANYFELGGNSFSVIELTRRLSRQLGRTCEVTRIFQYPTVRALAASFSQDSPLNEKRCESPTNHVPGTSASPNAAPAPATPSSRASGPAAAPPACEFNGNSAASEKPSRREQRRRIRSQLREGESP